VQQERLFEIAKEAGFKRIRECCPGVAYKLCSNDQWEGNIASLIEPLLAELRQEKAGRGLTTGTTFDGFANPSEKVEGEVVIPDYLALLVHSYAQSQVYHGGCPPESRLEFLADNLFDFTTYDGEISVLLAHTAVRVCEAITMRVTGDFIEDQGQYIEYLTMCNMPFFASKLEWGTSIRGAWWESYNGIEIDSCGLYIEDKQLLNLKLYKEEWDKFILAVVEFAKPEMTSPTEETVSS
jgi:hypothetical protein